MNTIVRLSNGAVRCGIPHVTYVQLHRLTDIIGGRFI